MMVRITNTIYDARPKLCIAPDDYESLIPCTRFGDKYYEAGSTIHIKVMDGNGRLVLKLPPIGTGSDYGIAPPITDAKVEFILMNALEKALLQIKEYLDHHLS